MRDLILAGGVAYYFNLIAIVVIAYFLLAIVYQRSKRVIINTAERPFKQDNTVVKLAFKLGIFLILFFVAREFDLFEKIGNFFDALTTYYEIVGEYIKSLKNG